MQYNLAFYPVSLDHGNRFLELEVGGDVEKFPYLWLRDNCQCDLCFEKKSFSRVVNLSEFPVDIKPKEVKVRKKNYWVIAT